MQKAHAYEMPGQVQVSVQRTTAPQVLRWWAPTCTPPACPVPNATKPEGGKALLAPNTSEDRSIHQKAVSGAAHL